MLHCNEKCCFGNVGGQNMTVKIAIDIAIIFFLVVAGYSQIAKGKAYVSNARYTEESIRAFSKPMGLLTWLLALSLALIFIGQALVFPPKTSNYLMYVGDAAVIVTCILYFIASNKYLKRKKTPMKYTYSKKKRK